MTEKGLLFIDIKPKSNTAEGTQSHTDTEKKRLWTRSDNSFQFNFFPEDRPAPQEETSPSDRKTQPSAKPTGLPAFTGHSSGFAFNFQIPPVAAEDMETESAVCPDSQNCIQVEKPSIPQQVNSPSEPVVASKPKKKKKSGKKKASDGSEVQGKPSPTEGSGGGEDPVLSAEEQLKRELDWCIEQLELGMRTQKGTPKQKEEASRALKTLRSSKAPLAKKRQVMRVMTGDYRKKMEEEKEKQFKLIERATASAQVKVVPDSSKKSVFYRRAETKSQTPAAEEKSNLQTLETQAEAPNEREDASAFVFTTSKEEFRFNFL